MSRARDVTLAVTAALVLAGAAAVLAGGQRSNAVPGPPVSVTTVSLYPPTADGAMSHRLIATYTAPPRDGCIPDADATMDGPGRYTVLERDPRGAEVSPGVFFDDLECVISDATVMLEEDVDPGLLGRTVTVNGDTFTVLQAPTQ